MTTGEIRCVYSVQALIVPASEARLYSLGTLGHTMRDGLQRKPMP